MKLKSIFPPALVPWIPLWLVFALPLLAAGDGDEEEIAALARQVVEAARDETGIDKAGQELAGKFAKLDHEKAIDALLPLLSHQKAGVPLLASYIISDCSSGLVPGDLEVLKKGFQNGGGWLPSAIASLKTDEATGFLANEFRKNPEIDGQLDSQLAFLGERAVPHLMELFVVADPTREAGFFDGVRHVFELMEGKAKEAVPRLMEICEDRKADAELRKQAVLSIGFIGAPAESVFPRLRVLAQQEPEFFSNVVRQSLLASGTSAAAELLADSFDAKPDHYTIREIALLGESGRVVGPRILGWLNHPDWDARVMAARTLGAVGYKEGRESLEKLLSLKTDWRLAYVAAQSLAELEAKESIPLLEVTAREHWFPIVRDAAMEAVKTLKEGKKPDTGGFSPAADLVSYTFVDRESLTIPAEKIPGLGERKPAVGTREDYSSFKDREPRMADAFRALRTKNNEGIFQESLTRIISFPIDGGMLLGASAGEWVGGLFYDPGGGEHQLFIEKNITGIDRWRNVLFAVSGTYHMGMNEGIIYKITNTNGDAAITPWFILPGCPTAMWLTDKDLLVVECEGGTVAFSDFDQFRYYGEIPAIKSSEDGK